MFCSGGKEQLESTHIVWISHTVYLLLIVLMLYTGSLGLFIWHICHFVYDFLACSFIFSIFFLSEFLFHILWDFFNLTFQPFCKWYFVPVVFLKSETYFLFPEGFFFSIFEPIKGFYIFVVLCFYLIWVPFVGLGEWPLTFIYWEFLNVWEFLMMFGCLLIILSLFYQ